MPGLLKDSAGKGCCRRKLPGSNSPDVDVQEWLMARYRYLRQELEDVDREVSQLQRQMQQRNEQRQERETLGELWEARERLGEHARERPHEQIWLRERRQQSNAQRRPENARSLRDMLNRDRSPVPEILGSNNTSRARASAVYHPHAY